MRTERAVYELQAQSSARLPAGRAGALAVAICACAFAGAIAAGGVSSRVGSPPTGSFSVIELGALVVLGGMAVLGLLALLWSKAWEEIDVAKRPPLWKRLLELVILSTVLAGALALLMMAPPRHPIHHKQPSSRGPAGRMTHVTHQSPRGPLDSSWARGAAFGAGALIGIVALFLIYRHPSRPAARNHEEEALNHAIAAGVEGLESETDPRRAVIKAYAGMEHALAEDGLPRLQSETPVEYLRRALERQSASTAATTRLTALFEQAKFSTHVIDESMRRDALAALGDLRTELAR
jgi:hypothetical protein